MHKKIAFFHTEFAYSGGAEKLLFNQVDYLTKKGFLVDVYTGFIDKKTCFPEIIAKYNIKQILPEFINNLFAHDLIIILTTLIFPIVCKRYQKYDLYIGENQAGPWWAAMASKFWGRPYFTYQGYPTTITHPREIDKRERRNSWITNILLYILRPIIKHIDIYIIRGAKVSLANGKYAKRVCEKAYGKKFVNCPGGTEKGKFDQRVFRERFVGTLNIAQSQIKKPYILITNRHFPAKRLDFGIKILKKLVTNERSQIVLVLTGAETSYTKKLKRMVERLVLAKRVIFTGLVNEVDLKKLYQNALVYIYTAPEEDYGLGILEAMAYGVPVVVWDKAGPSYLVLDGKTGYKVAPGDISEFGNKVERLIINEGLNFRLARRAFEFSKNFSWENHGQVLEDVLAPYV